MRIALFMACFNTGCRFSPSATSDIELDRLEGIHGPRTLDVLINREEPRA